MRIVVGSAVAEPFFASLPSAPGPTWAATATMHDSGIVAIATKARLFGSHVNGTDRCETSPRVTWSSSGIPTAFAASAKPRVAATS